MKVFIVVSEACDGTIGDMIVFQSMEGATSFVSERSSRGSESAEYCERYEIYIKTVFCY